MRKLFTYVLVAAAAMAGFTSCSDDDNNDPQLFELPAESKTMTPSNGLTFVSNGQSLSDVTLQYVPAADGKSAILDIFGSNASRAASRAESPVIVPGDVLPGAASVSINVTPKFEADRATFEGDAESTYCTFHYDGTITATTIQVNFTNIVMKNGVIISTLTFTDADVDHMLELTYNGAPLMGKTVSFKPDASDFKRAVLTLAGQALDLTDLLATAQLPVDLSKLSKIQTPGVIPGTSSFELPVVLGDDNTFSGSAETAFVTFNYEGQVASEKLVFNITEAKLKNAPLSENKWYVPHYFYNEDTWEYEGNPVHFVWESSAKFNIDLGGLVLPFPPADLVGIMLQMGLIPQDDNETASITQMISRSLKTIEFHPDGNIIAGYVENGKVGGPVIQSPAGLAQYVIASDGTLLLYLNPQAIIMNVMKAQNEAAKSRAIDFSKYQATIDGLAEMLARCVSEGFPITYANGIYKAATEEGEDSEFINTDDNLSVYANTEFILPILKAVAPIFNDEEVRQTIMNLAGQNEDFAAMAPMLDGILKSVPDVVEGTTKIEAGIILTKNEPIVSETPAE